jgi:GTP-binding protein
VINRELANYNPELADRPQIVVATKMDALDEPERLAQLEARARKDRKRFYAISSATRSGVDDLVSIVARMLDEISHSKQGADTLAADAS